MERRLCSVGSNGQALEVLSGPERANEPREIPVAALESGNVGEEVQGDRKHVPCDAQFAEVGHTAMRGQEGGVAIARAVELESVEMLECHHDRCEIWLDGKRKGDVVEEKTLEVRTSLQDGQKIVKGRVDGGESDLQVL